MHFIDYIYFFYGLAFFIFGFSILHYPTENSIFKFARELKYLGMFGILHGISEWFMLFMMLETGAVQEAFNIASFTAMSLSYGVLLYFAARVIWSRFRAMQLLVLLTTASFMILMAFDHLSFQNLNIIVRYTLGTPGIFLTAYIFLHPAYIVQGSIFESIKRCTAILSATFIAYGVLAGIIVPAGDFFPASLINAETFQNITGLPVQLFRAICAVLASYAIGKILHVFKNQTDFHIQKLSKALEESGDTVVITNIDGKIEYVNRAFEEQTGYSLQEIVDKNPNVLRSGEHKKSFYEQMWQTILNGKIYKGVLTNKRKDATLYYEFKTIVPLKNKKGSITNFISTGKDITDRIMFEKELAVVAATDPLTGAANRLQCDRWLQTSAERAQKSHATVSMILFDIDDFKKVNDTFGHNEGDKVLIGISNIVRSTIRSSDLFARWGGEEFVILQIDTPFEGTVMLAERIRQEIEKTLFDTIGHVTISLGISKYTPPEDSKTFVKKADDALYRAKNEGKNKVVIAGDDAYVVA